MKTDKFTLFVYCNFLVLLSTTVCSQNINKHNVNIADETFTDYSFLSRYHFTKSKNYLERRYRIRHWIPMFIGTPCIGSARAQIQTLKSSILHHKNVLYIPNDSLKIFPHSQFITIQCPSLPLRVLSWLEHCRLCMILMYGRGELFPFGVFLRSNFLYKLVMKNLRSDHAMHLFTFLGGWIGNFRNISRF